MRVHINLESHKDNFLTIYIQPFPSNFLLLKLYLVVSDYYNYEKIRNLFTVHKMNLSGVVYFLFNCTMIFSK